MNHYSFPPGNGEHIVEVTLPATVSLNVAANSLQSFNIHVELSGNQKLPPLAAALLDKDGNTVAATADSRTLGSNQPHFVTVGKPKTTASKTDYEVEPGAYSYNLVAVGDTGGAAGVKVKVGIQRS